VRSIPSRARIDRQGDSNENTRNDPNAWDVHNDVPRRPGILGASELGTSCGVWTTCASCYQVQLVATTAAGIPIETNESDPQTLQRNYLRASEFR